MEQCWRGSRLAIRMALIRYLRSASPHVNIITDLESVWDPRYESLIQLRQPAYVIPSSFFFLCVKLFWLYL
jgi:hypothetical protein